MLKLGFYSNGGIAEVKVKKSMLHLYKLLQSSHLNLHYLKKRQEVEVGLRVKLAYIFFRVCLYAQPIFSKQCWYKTRKHWLYALYPIKYPTAFLLLDSWSTRSEIFQAFISACGIELELYFSRLQVLYRTDLLENFVKITGAKLFLCKFCVDYVQMTVSVKRFSIKFFRKYKNKGDG